MTREHTVWQNRGGRWQRVRVRVPGEPRSGKPSEGVPRPPLRPAHAVGAEDASRTELTSVLARAIVDELVNRFGGVVVLLAVGLLTKRRQER